MVPENDHDTWEHEPGDRNRRRGPVGSRVGAQIKRELSFLPAYPLAPTAGNRWRTFGLHEQGTITAIDSSDLQRIERVLKKGTVYREHVRLPQIPNKEAWLKTINHWLEEQKRVIHRREVSGIETWIDRLAPSLKESSKLHELRNRSGPASDLIDSLIYLELTGNGELLPDFVAWLETHSAAFDRIHQAVPAEIRLDAADGVRAIHLIRARVPAELQRRFFDLFGEISPWWMNEAFSSERTSLLNQLTEDQQSTQEQNTKREAVPSVGQRLVQSIQRMLNVPEKHQKMLWNVFDRCIPEEYIFTIEACCSLHRQTVQEIKIAGKPLKQVNLAGRDIVQRAVRQEYMEKTLPTADELRVEYSLNTLDFYLRTWRRSKLLTAWQSLLDVVSCEGMAEPTWYCCMVNTLQPILDSLDVAPSDYRWHRRWNTQLLRFKPGKTFRLDWQNAIRNKDLCPHESLFSHRIDLLRGLFVRRDFHLLLERTYRLDKQLVEDPISSLLCAPVSEEKQFKQILALFEAMVYDHDKRPTENLVFAIVDLVSLGVALPDARKILGSLTEVDYAEFDHEKLRVCLYLTRDPAMFLQVWKACIDGDTLFSAIKLLETSKPPTELRALFARLLQQGERQRVESMARVASAVVSSNVGHVEPGCYGSDTAWIAQYPAEMRESLEQLSRVTGDAEKIVSRLAQRWFPNRSALAEELAAIQSRLETIQSRLEADEPSDSQKGLLIRRDRLQARIESWEPFPVGSVRKVLREIRDGLDLFAADYWLATTRSKILQSLATSYPDIPFPESLLESPNHLLLGGLLQLDRAVRKSGIELLCQSLAGAPVSSLSHPDNVKFIEGLRKKGIDLDPWLDQRIRVETRTHSGEPYELCFTLNPIDILMMGQHFQTCLSPGEINFFSTVSIALDANKRVVYGKTSEGKIIGRRLFALTDQGLIQGFRAYFHDKQDGFEQASDQFAQKLASSMGTFLTTRSEITRLVLKQWYNDGARMIDVDRSMDSEAGILRNSLDACDTGNFIERLSELLGGMNRLIDCLPLIPAMIDFEERPELLQPLVECYLSHPQDPIAAIRLACKCHDAGAISLLSRFKIVVGEDDVLALLAKNACFECSAYHPFDLRFNEVFRMFVALDRKLAQRWLHVHRPGAKRAFEGGNYLKELEKLYRDQLRGRKLRTDAQS
jgi:hypothetical protein